MPKPCPSGPVVTSTPGVSPYSGCPGVFDPHCRNCSSCSIGRSYPDRCSAPYSSADAWPFDSTNRSRSVHFECCRIVLHQLVNSRYAIGAQPSGAPGCPLLAFCTASTARNRSVLIDNWSSSFCRPHLDTSRPFRVFLLIYPQLTSYSTSRPYIPVSHRPIPNSSAPSSRAISSIYFEAFPHLTFRASFLAA